MCVAKLNRSQQVNPKFFLARSELRSQILRVPFSETKLKKHLRDKTHKNKTSPHSAHKSAKTWAGCGKTGEERPLISSTAPGGSKKA